MRNLIHRPPGEHSAGSDEVAGFGSASRRQSHTTPDGALRIDLIDGVQYRLTRPVSHRHGHLTEAFRADWGVTDAPVVQVNVSVTFPGKIRAWGIHRFTIDRLFAATGSLRIVCYDGTDRALSAASMSSSWEDEIRASSLFRSVYSTAGRTSVTMKRRSSACPSQLYDHEGPDRWELMWDSAAARKIIPYEW